MTTSKKVPPHGTVARYRIELRKGKACEKCKAANSLARRQYRAAAKKRGSRAQLTLVPDTHSDTHEMHTPASTQPETSASTNDDLPGTLAGEMEQAVLLDIADAASTVAFHRSLTAMAISLAREVDSAESKASKASSIKQLAEVLNALRSKEGDSGKDADPLLELLSQPLLPGMPAPDRNAKKPKQPDARNA